MLPERLYEARLCDSHLRPRTGRSRAAFSLVLTALILGLAACGGDEEDAGGAKRESRKQAAEQAVEKAFLTAMVHHHGSAIDMAEIARERGEDPFLRRLADDILTAQRREIRQMRAIHKRLFGAELEPDPRAHDGLGLSAEEAGMTHDERMNDMLRAVGRFDRAFVDEMTPHHEGAVRMAEVVLKATDDPELRTLAKAIASSQKREVRQMNAFRVRKYGGPVPDGGGHGAGEPEHGAGHSG